MSKYDNSTLMDMADATEHFITKASGQWVVASDAQWFGSKKEAMEALARLDGYDSVADYRKKSAEGWDLETSWRSREA